MKKFITTVQNVSVIAMNDLERHLKEYKKYEGILNDNIKSEKDPQKLYWFKNRLKSVINRIRVVEYDIQNG